MESPQNAQFAPEECKWCNGSGVDRDQTDNQGRIIRCMSCEGQGRVHVALPSMACVRCKGKGGETGAKNLTGLCEICHGTGWSLRWVPPNAT